MASDGGVFTFGDAQFYGSTGAMRLNQPVVGMAPTSDDGGYWLVASDGGVFTFGDAQFYGSLGGNGSSVLGIIVSRGGGYAEVTTDGSEHAFGPLASPLPPVIGPAPAGTSWASGGSSSEPSTYPSAVVDTTMQAVIESQLGPGWVAGDTSYSTTLPDGREAFVYSDTLIGTAQPSGAAHMTRWVDNGELVGDLPYLATDIAGTYHAPAALIPDTFDSDATWQTASTYAEGGKQLIFVNATEHVPEGPFDKDVGSSGIAVMSVPPGGLPTLASVTLLPTDPETEWGNAMMQSGGYTYVYGSDLDPTTGAVYGMKIARVPVGESLDTGAWDYWNGSQWVGGESNAVAVPTVYQLTGVVPNPSGNGFVAVSVPNSVYTDTTVDLSFSSSPTGPWSVPEPVYSIPQIGQYRDEIAYMPTFHPELSSGNVLVVSYNINTTDGLSAVAQNVRQYQPQFIDISG